MLILLSMIWLVLSALIMLALRLRRPGFGYHWLIAIGGAIIAWVMVLLGYTSIPDRLQIESWSITTAYPNSIILQLDQVSWPFAAAIGTLLVAVLLSDVVRAYDLTWSNWASSLVLAAIGFVGVLSGNLITFILAWTAYDLIVLSILLVQMGSGEQRRRTISVFFVHLIGTACLLAAGVISVSDNNSVLLEQASPGAIGFVVLAAGLRLGALPLGSNLLEDANSRRSFGTMRSLVSMAMVTIFLVRVAAALENILLPGYLTLGFFSLLGVAGLFFSISWLFASNELAGRQAWIMGYGCLVLASMLRAEVGASLSWSLAAIFSGGLILIASVREKISLWINLLGLVGISALPFTPAWLGLGLFSNPFNVPLVLFFAASVLLILGFIRHASTVTPAPPGLERWIKVVYPLGLLLLPITHAMLGWIYKPEVGSVSPQGWILGALMLSLAVGGFLIWQARGRGISQRLIKGVDSILDFAWLSSIFRSLFNYLGRMMSFVSRILEGEGGILWVLLSIVLFLAVLVISMGT